VTFVNQHGLLQTLPKEKLSSGYRFSSFQQQKCVIVSARFQLEPSKEARKKQLTIIDYRTKTQPYGEMSAGCVFRNPPQNSAGKLIEESGLKAFEKEGQESHPFMQISLSIQALQQPKM
jgi:UDP-N-acetylmuramate dehydrogenase